MHVYVCMCICMAKTVRSDSRDLKKRLPCTKYSPNSNGIPDSTFLGRFECTFVILKLGSLCSHSLCFCH